MTGKSTHQLIAESVAAARRCLFTAELLAAWNNETVVADLLNEQVAALDGLTPRLAAAADVAARRGPRASCTPADGDRVWAAHLDALRKHGACARCDYAAAAASGGRATGPRR